MLWLVNELISVTVQSALRSLIEKLRIPADGACAAGLEPGNDARFVEWMLARKSDDNLLCGIFCLGAELILTNGAILLE